MKTIACADLAALQQEISAEFGPWSAPLTVTQDMIERFADLTGDRQWIHVDVERARRESPLGTTIAHGFLLLSLLLRLTRLVLLQLLRGQEHLGHLAVRTLHHPERLTFGGELDAAAPATTATTAALALTRLARLPALRLALAAAGGGGLLGVVAALVALIGAVVGSAFELVLGTVGRIVWAVVVVAVLGIFAHGAHTLARGGPADLGSVMGQAAGRGRSCGKRRNAAEAACCLGVPGAPPNVAVRENTGDPSRIRPAGKGHPTHV